MSFILQSPQQSHQEPVLVKKIKNNDQLACSQTLELELKCEKEDLLIIPREEVANNFKEFLNATKDIGEDVSELRKFGKLFKIDYNKWPTVEDAKLLFDRNFNDTHTRCKKWSEVDKTLMYWVVIRYCIRNNIYERNFDPTHWRNISKLIIGRNAHQCKSKWQQKIKVAVSQVPWTREEDRALIEIHQEFEKLGKSNKWSQIAQAVRIRSQSNIYRQPKQCRERWINKLDPNISNLPWTRESEIELLKTIMIKGKKWAELSKLYNYSRSENFLKNRYHILIKREKQRMELEKIDPELFAKVQEARMKTGALEEIDNYEWQYIVLAIQRLEQEKQQFGIERNEQILTNSISSPEELNYEKKNKQEVDNTKKTCNIKLNILPLGCLDFNGKKIKLCIMNKKNQKIINKSLHFSDVEDLMQKDGFLIDSNKATHFSGSPHTMLNSIFPQGGSYNMQKSQNPFEANLKILGSYPQNIYQSNAIGKSMNSYLVASSNHSSIISEPKFQNEIEAQQMHQQNQDASKYFLQGYPQLYNPTAMCVPVPHPQYSQQYMQMPTASHYSMHNWPFKQFEDSVQKTNAQSYYQIQGQNRNLEYLKQNLVSAPKKSEAPITKQKTDEVNINELFKKIDVKYVGDSDNEVECPPKVQTVLI